jgi:SAM-dependent methyltransferase
VTLSDVAEEGLVIAEGRARKLGVPLTTLRWNVETEGIPPGSWDLVLCVHFLFRPVFSLLSEALAPGGLFAICHPTRSNLERNSRPSQRFLLEDGEVLGLLPADFEVLFYQEGWNEDRHEAWLVVRKPGE